MPKKTNLKKKIKKSFVRKSCIGPFNGINCNNKVRDCVRHNGIYIKVYDCEVTVYASKRVSAS